MSGADALISVTLRERIARFAPGASVRRAWQLKGGISARMLAVELDGAGAAPARLVVRELRYGDLAQRRRALAREHQTQRAVHGFGLPVAAPYALDDPGGDSEPALLLEYVEALPDFTPRDIISATQQMAEVLRMIHRVPGQAPSLQFLPRRPRPTGDALAKPADQLDASLGEARIRGALAAAGSWPPGNPDLLLHGDYWPGNLLWKDGSLARVVDWEESEVGDPLFDLAVARLDLLFVFGPDAAQAFTRQYQALAPELDYGALPRWDLCAALRPMGNIARWAAAYHEPPIGRADITEHTMRAAHAAFTDAALARLGC